MPAEKLTPVHPGELLREEFLEPLGITPHALAIAIGVPATRIHAIVRERRGITADTALRLSRYLGLSESYWLNVQARYDLLMAREALGAELARIQPRQTA
jgi:antitoxin HigA-1